MRARALFFLLFLSLLVFTEQAEAGFMWSGNVDGDNTSTLNSNHRARKKHIDEIIQNLLSLYDTTPGCLPLKPSFGAGTVHPDLVWNGNTTAIQLATTPIRAAHISTLQTSVNALYQLTHAGASCPGLSPAPVAGTSLVAASYINELRACLDNMKDVPGSCNPPPRCGDGAVNVGEQCDNDISPIGTPPNSGDGCSSTCQNEAAMYWACNNIGTNCDGSFYSSQADCLSAHPGKLCWPTQQACVDDATASGCPGGAGDLTGWCGSGVGTNQCQYGERAYIDASNGAVHCVTDATCGGNCVYQTFTDTGVCCGMIGQNFTIKTMVPQGGAECTIASVCSPAITSNACGGVYCDGLLPPTIDPTSCGPIFGCPAGYCRYGYTGGGGSGGGYCDMGCLQTTKCNYPLTGPFPTCVCDPTICARNPVTNRYNFACQVTPTNCADGVSTNNATNPMWRCYSPQEVWTANGNSGSVPPNIYCI